MPKIITDISSPDQVKLSFNIDADFLTNNPSLENTIATVEKVWIKKAVGKDFYDEIIAAAEDTTPEPEDIALLDAVRNAIIHIAYAEWLPNSSVIATSNGLKQSTSEDRQSIFNWQYKVNLKEAWKKAHNSMAMLFEFLEENAGDYATWSTSDNFTQLKSCLVDNANVFDKYFPIDGSAWVFVKFKHLIKEAQNSGLKGLLGIGYLNELIDEHTSGTISDTNQPIYELAQAYLVAKTIAMACDRNAVMVDQLGFTEFEDTTGDQTVDNRKASDASKIKSLMKAQLSVAKNALENIKTLLYASPDDFPTWKASPLYKPTVDSQIMPSEFGNGITYIE